MSKAIKDIVFFGLIGLLLGLIIGGLLAGGYITWRLGLAMEGMDLSNALLVAPGAQGHNPLWWQHVLYITGGAGVLGAVAMVALAWKPNLTTHGSAKWATPQEMQQDGLLSTLKNLPGPIYAKLSRPKGRGRFVSSGDIPHSFIAAPTGSGKGVGVVIPTLLTYPGSIICLDVKGENYAASARQRVKLGDKVYKFAPFDEEEKTHRFNPLHDVAQLPEKRRYSEAQRIAESLVVLPGDGAKSFLPSAKQILAATIMVACERGFPTLSAVHDILSQAGDEDQDGEGGFTALFKKLSLETNIEEAKQIYTRMSAIDYKTVSAYMSVLFDGGLGQWRDPFVRAATADSDFTVADLRRVPASIYIIVNPNDLDILAPLIRLMFQQTVSVLQRAEPGEDEPYPVLLLMDEFPSLGKMETMAKAISTIRAYGGRLMIVAQSISNLKGAYGPDSAQNFLANCRLQLFMAPADAETPEYVSKAIGDFTRKSRSKSWQTNQLTGGNVQERTEGARLMRPEDLRRLSEDEVVLLIQGSNPVKANKVRYYEDRELKAIYEGQTGPMPQPPVTVEGEPSLESVLAPPKGIVIPQEVERKLKGAKKNKLVKPTDTLSSGKMVGELDDEEADAITTQQGNLMDLIQATKQKNRQNMA